MTNCRLCYHYFIQIYTENCILTIFLILDGGRGFFPSLFIHCVFFPLLYPVPDVSKVLGLKQAILEPSADKLDYSRETRGSSLVSELKLSLYYTSWPVDTLMWAHIYFLHLESQLSAHTFAYCLLYKRWTWIELLSGSERVFLLYLTCTWY